MPPVASSIVPDETRTWHRVGWAGERYRREIEISTHARHGNVCIHVMAANARKGQPAIHSAVGLKPLEALLVSWWCFVGAIRAWLHL